MSSLQRRSCDWPAGDALMQRYHDTEWGVPLHDDRKLFEFLVLEGMQAGLSWRTVLHKRAHLRAAFDRFDPETIACYRESKVRQLLQDAGIIRNRLKIEAAITNAHAFLKVQQQHGSAARFMWEVVGGAPIRNTWTALTQLPCRTPESDQLSAKLREAGFRFVGSTICYAHMQATGMVNDHLTHCFRHREVAALAKPAARLVTA